jgi:putative ATP-grasp target RiPP
MTERILCTAFAGLERLATGPLPEVAVAARIALAADPTLQLLVFNDATGAVIDLDLRGSETEIRARLEPPAETDLPSRGRGRPKLGVVAREVTLLPRHWDWLGAQPGGASQALRRLIDQARRADDGRTEIRLRQETAYRFLCALAGNLHGFEEAARALFANDRARFTEQTAAWPLDVCAHASKLAWPEP